MADDTLLELRLRVAGVSLILRFLPRSVMPISQRLLAFQAGPDEKMDHPIIVQFIPEAPDQNIYQEQLRLQPDRQMHMAQQGENMLFTCRVGQFLANHDFTRIELWSPYDSSICVDEGEYDGYPFLQLIIWGRLSLTGTCYLHGAIVVIDGHYVLLLGDSGVGKSTLSGLAVQKGATMLTDENPFLTWQQDSPWVYPAPWPGFTGPLVPAFGPLDAIFFLRHATGNTLQRLTLPEAGRRLLGNARMFNWLPETIPGAVELLDKTLHRVPVYNFGFVPDLSAVEAIMDVI